MPIDLPISTLRALVTLAERGSFTAAARELGIAQSSLSRAVTQAERAARQSLFERTTRRVTLTEPGRVVVDVARTVLADYDTGIAHLEGYLSGSRGALRLATLPSLAASLLPPFLKQYRSSHPEVALTVDDALSKGALASLLAGESDLALIAPRGALPTHLASRALATDSFYLIVPSDHPLADLTTTSWSSLHGERLISFAHATSIRSAVDRAIEKYSLRVVHELEARNVTTVGGLVAGGLGVSVIPAFVLPMLTSADISAVELTPTERRPVLVVRDRRRPLTRPARAWLDLLWAETTYRPDLPGVSWAGPRP